MVSWDLSPQQHFWATLGQRRNKTGACVWIPVQQHRLSVWISPCCWSSVLQPRLKAGHCKSPKATAEEVEQIKAVGGSEASWITAHVDSRLVVIKRSMLYLSGSVRVPGHCRTTSAGSPFLNSLARYQLNVWGSGRPWFPTQQDWL